MKRLSPSAAGALIAAVLAGAFFACFARVDGRADTGLRGEAARDPYLAAERMLAALGLPVTRVPRISELRELPPPDATLIWTGSRVGLSSERTEQLADWAARGGHLVVRVGPRRDDSGPGADPLLDPLGVRSLEQERGEPPAGPDRDSRALATWLPQPRAAPLQLHFERGSTLRLEGRKPDAEVSDGSATYGVSVPVGEGHVTVWTDDRFLTSAGIAELDHAEVLARWVRLFGHSGATWFVRGGAQGPDLWARFWRDAWALAVALGAWLGFHVWAHAPRFGPAQPDPPLERRELMEHVQAAGHFLLRHGGAKTLLDAVRGALLRRLRLRHPQWPALAPAVRARRIAEWTGLPPGDVEPLLEAGSERSASADFAARVAALETLRRKL